MSFLIETINQICCSQLRFCQPIQHYKYTEIATIMIPINQTYIPQLQHSVNQWGSQTSNIRKLNQQSDIMELISEYQISPQFYQPPKNFHQLKQKIDGQLYKTLGCLSQKNKQNLLVGMNKCNLIKKDSEIFLENFESLKKDKKESPQEIQKYLSFQTGGQFSSEQRKQLY